jgi:hypothetical protein
MTLTTLALALGALAQAVTGPTAAQFNAALTDACPDFPATTRNVSCQRAAENAMEFACRYELQEEGGRWSRKQALLTFAEGQWVWIDGETRCGDEAAPELN